MSKYSLELKLHAVKDYLSGEGSYQSIANKYKVTDSSRIQDWVHIYRTFGEAGLQRKRENQAYSPQFKLNAVNLYLTSERSYREIAYALGINNFALITRWVLDYRKQGALAFVKSRGRPRKEPSMSKAEKSSDIIQTDQELKKLQEEVLHLRIENAYLKGLRRLRMEQQARENPSLFKTSTDTISSQSNNS